MWARWEESGGAAPELLVLLKHGLQQGLIGAGCRELSSPDRSSSRQPLHSVPGCPLKGRLHPRLQPLESPRRPWVGQSPTWRDLSGFSDLSTTTPCQPSVSADCRRNDTYLSWSHLIGSLRPG